jgi:hypothetical protein
MTRTGDHSHTTMGQAVAARECVKVTLARRSTDRLRSLTIKVNVPATVRNDLVLSGLAARPFMYDLANGRLILFWQMTTPAGVHLLVRPSEHFRELEELACAEVRFVFTELAHLRGQPRKRLIFRQKGQDRRLLATARLPTSMQRCQRDIAA